MGSRGRPAARSSNQADYFEQQEMAASGLPDSTSRAITFRRGRAEGVAAKGIQADIRDSPGRDRAGPRQRVEFAVRVVARTVSRSAKSPRATLWVLSRTDATQSSVDAFSASWCRSVRRSADTSAAGGG